MFLFPITIIPVSNSWSISWSEQFTLSSDLIYLQRMLFMLSSHVNLLRATFSDLVTEQHPQIPNLTAVAVTVSVKSEVVKSAFEQSPSMLLYKYVRKACSVYTESSSGGLLVGHKMLWLCKALWKFLYWAEAAILVPMRVVFLPSKSKSSVHIHHSIISESPSYFESGATNEKPKHLRKPDLVGVTSLLGCSPFNLLIGYKNLCTCSSLLFLLNLFKVAVKLHSHKSEALAPPHSKS